MIYFGKTRIIRFQRILKSTFLRFTSETWSGQVPIYEGFLVGNAETKVGRSIIWHPSQLLQLDTHQKREDVHVLGSSERQFGVWGLLIKSELDNSSLGIDINDESWGAGSEEFICICALVIFSPFLLVMSAPSPLADIVIYKITAEGFLNYTGHSLSLAIIKKSAPSKSQ